MTMKLRRTSLRTEKLRSLHVDSSVYYCLPFCLSKVHGSRQWEEAERRSYSLLQEIYKSRGPLQEAGWLYMREFVDPYPPRAFYPPLPQPNHTSVFLENPLLDDAGDEASGHGPATLTNVEALADLNSVGVGHGANHLDVVTRHDHLARRVLSALGEGQVDGLIGRPEV